MTETFLVYIHMYIMYIYNVYIYTLCLIAAQIATACKQCKHKTNIPS